jgi:acetyl esterase/lipase
MLAAAMIIGACTETPPPLDAAADTAASLRDAPPVDALACMAFTGPAPVPTALGPCSNTLPSTPTGEITETRELGVVVRRNVVVAERGGYVLEADLWLPAMEGGGVLVLVHGGGWLDCDNRRETMSIYAEIVARTLSIAVLNIEYRLAQEGGGYPENVSDVICAVQWAHARATERGFDDRVAIMGSSAGAHLALMAGLVGERPDLDPGCGTDSSVAAVVAWAAPTDLPTFVLSDSLAQEAPGYYTGEDCSSAVDGCAGDARACTRCVDASPLAHVCTARAPFYLVQAPDPYDLLVPETQARVFAAALEAAGGDVTLVVPTDAEMRAAGCTPEGGSHALDGCTLMVAGPIVHPALQSLLGPR